MKLSDSGLDDLPSSVKAVIFYDGACGFCSASVRFIHRRDHKGKFYFAPLQGETARKLIPAEYHAPGEQGTLVLWSIATQGNGNQAELRLRSEAALTIGRQLKAPWSICATMGFLIPKGLREAAYRWIAKNRHRLRRSEQCELPSPEMRERLLP